MADALGFSFTDVTPDDGRIWTAGFLNERFPGPVSPLGWTLIRESLEVLALRDPLRYLGVGWDDDRPLTRLYRGHPYTDVEAFWSIYKLFPDSILPDDAARYFPGGDVSLRKRVSQPAGLWDPRVWWALGRAALADLDNWLPWRNWRSWRHFEPDFCQAIVGLEEQTRAAETGGSSITPAELWSVLDETHRLNRRLLRRHRWSLTHADLTYTALGRLLEQVTGEPMAAAWCARLAAGAPNMSLKVDADLARLAAIQRDGGPGLDEAWDGFIAQHGHRSFSLDIYHPPYAADPDAVRSLLTNCVCDSFHEDAGTDIRRDTWTEIAEALPGIAGKSKACLIHRLARLTRIYMALREDQRYRWQQGLALMRRLAIVLGQCWAERQVLGRPSDVFFVTWKELADGVSDGGSLPDPRAVSSRRNQFEKLQAEWASGPVSGYPAFLRGNEPWASEESPAAKADSGVYLGRGASPGRARGPVRRVADPWQLGELMPGEVLVARSTDPAWTPAFGRIAGLVTETGGMLSHGAVVAREYGLPAVVAVAGVFDEVGDGQLVEVDGMAGRVSIIAS